MAQTQETARTRRRTTRKKRQAPVEPGSGPTAAALPPVVPFDVVAPIEVKYARGKNHELLVSVNDAAKLAAVSRRTIYNWIAAGKVDVQFAPSGTQRVVVKSIWRGADDRETVTTATAQAYREVETSA